MADAVFRILQAGPLVTIQDSGRPHLMRYGVPRSGPMDRTSYAIANAALGNAPHAPCIEISMGGLTLECLAGDITLAVAGGGFSVAVDGDRISSWNVFTVKKGQRLSIKAALWGCWTYLAFAGELKADRWLGSTATHVQSGLGGGKLSADMTITVGSSECRTDRVGEIPFPVWARPRHIIRVVLGPQDRFFDEQAIHALFHDGFRLTDAYDRMGVCLRGPVLVPKEALSIPSEAILRGSIQVSGDGNATVLLADHQTTGGYPKIATVISTDIDGFCQLRPHDEIKFVNIDPVEAIAITRRRARALQGYLSHL